MKPATRFPLCRPRSLNNRAATCQRIYCSRKANTTKASRTPAGRWRDHSSDCCSQGDASRKSTAQRNMFGFLNIDKPGGITSRDVVNRIERLVRPAKCGHAGTLDPLATGVLVVAVG